MAKPSLLITVIGRGHSGTRAMAQTLSDSGVFMGAPLNDSSDLLPPEAMYDACRVLSRHVQWHGDLEWDWSALHTMDIPQEFSDLIHGYLASVHASPARRKGWKIPETTLVLPWIVRLFPRARYIFWIRDPRDSIVGGHLTDDLHDFGIPYPATDELRLQRAYSWIYQYKLVRATPKPRHWIEVRLEDFVLRQEQTLARLEVFLGFPLSRIPVKPEVIGRWKQDQAEGGVNDFPFFASAKKDYGYE